MLEELDRMIQSVDDSREAHEAELKVLIETFDEIDSRKKDFYSSRYNSEKIKEYEKYKKNQLKRTWRVVGMYMVLSALLVTQTEMVVFLLTFLMWEYTNVVIERLQVAMRRQEIEDEAIEFDIMYTKEKFLIVLGLFAMFLLFVNIFINAV